MPKRPMTDFEREQAGLGVLVLAFALCWIAVGVRVLTASTMIVVVKFSVLLLVMTLVGIASTRGGR